MPGDRPHPSRRKDGSLPRSAEEPPPFPQDLPARAFSPLSTIVHDNTRPTGEELKVTEAPSPVLWEHIEVYGR